MNDVNFGELNGYNTVIEYSMQLLEIIKSLTGKKPDFEAMKELADPKYEYASAKLICMVQTIEFFQIYEKYGKDISVSSKNIKKIVELLKDFKIDNNSDIDLEKKEKIFRNCLAHGRYTLSMSDDGKINVIFNDPSLVIDGKSIEITGKMPYTAFSKLSSEYIESVNIEKTEIENDPVFEPTSIKNFSMDRIYRTFFQSIKKVDAKFEKDFDVYNNFEEAIRDYQKNIENQDGYINFQKESARFLKNEKEKITRNQTPITEEEKEFFKKYFDFIGKHKFVKSLNLQFNRLRKMRTFENGKFKSKEMAKIYEIAQSKAQSIDYCKMLEIILNSRDGKLSVIEDCNMSLDFFINTINHMNQLENTERASYKSTEEALNTTIGRLFNIDITQIPLPERGEQLRYEIEKFSYLTPILYSNILIAMTSYAIGYAKEVNSNYNKEIFDFKNIDLRGITPIFEDINRPSVKNVDLHSKAEKALNIKIEEQRNSIIRKIKKDLNFTNKKGKNSFDTISELVERNSSDVGKGYLEKNKEMKQELNLIFTQLDSEADEDKNANYILQEDGKILKSKLQSYINTIKENEKLKENIGLRKTSEDITNRLSGVIEKIDELSEVNKEIVELRQEVTKTSGEVPYEDSSVFFDHIRNSFTHSYFRIDYNELFSTKDFSKIKFHIEDYDKNEDGTKRKTFEIDLTAEDLIYLIGEIQKRLNKSVDSNKRVELENVHLNSIRDDKEIPRYDITKYDSQSHPIKPVKKDDRATGEEFEASVSEDVLMKGLMSNTLKEIQKVKEEGERKK